MEFFHNDIKVLSELRNKIQFSVNSVWCYVWIKNQTGVKLQIRNEFDNSLDERRLNQCLELAKGFCEENNIDYQTTIEEVKVVSKTEVAQVQKHL